MVHDFSQHPSALNACIAEIRSAEIQTDRLRFRTNLQRIGAYAAFELSKSFEYQVTEVITPLGSAEVALSDEPVVVASILRAGLPMHDGVLQVFDRAGNAFVSAYRKYTEDDEFDVHVEYLSSPDLNGKTLVLVDPMIATGQSMVMAYKALLGKGAPAKMHIISAIASKEGLQHVRQQVPSDTRFWVGAIDDELTARAYIVPGLGDAGDLAFGPKEG